MKYPVAFLGEQIKRIVAALVLTMVLTPILLLAYPFGSAVGYTVGFGPHGIVAADLNGDGKLDLASANAEDGTVSVLIGNGDGTYLPHTDYPVGTRPKFVQTGDFNRDGKVDLIAANEVSGSVTVLPGKGDGTFGPGISSPAGCISPHAIQVADLNGDGKLDAIVACWNGTIVSVLFGNGDGTFQTAVNYTTGAWPEAVIIGDFNKDGKLDFAINNYMANTISVLLGTGGGSFAPAVSYAVGTLPHFINAADLNKDGNLDLFTANDGSNDVSVLFGTGTGTFSPAVSLSVGTSPESVAVGDVDGDGNLDLVTANSVSNDLSVLLGTGTGTFAKPVSYPVGTTPFHVILAQLNGDGKLDAAVGNYGANNISVLLSSAGGPPPPGTVYLSDLAWTSAANGWGPVERDMSNGEQAAGDGQTISLRGTKYAKGLGVHALSDIQYAIGTCTSFTSVIGIDDEVNGNGSVVFQVLLNGVKQYDSGVMTGADAAKSVSLNLTGISQLELVVAVGATQNFDHADWANAQITCSATTPQPPTVTSASPASGATGVAVNTTVNGTFSSVMQTGSLTTSTVTLVQQGTTALISGTVGYNATTKTVTLTPAAPLAGGTVYTATIKGGASGAKDSTGTPMAADFAWSFTTASTGGGTGSSALQLLTVAPCRVIDTRNPKGPLGGPFIAAGTSRTIPIPSSACGVPANAVAYSLNITVVPRTGSLGYLTVWPTDQTQPSVSTLNSPDGSVLANAAIVPAGTAGSINAFAANDTDLIVDINGYFVPPAVHTLQFFPLTPCRVLDTRNANGVFGGPAITGGNSRSFPILSSPCKAPAGAVAYSFNVTAVPQGPLGYLTAWPTGQPQPAVSTLNSLDGTVLANAAIVPAGTGGAASFFASDTTDLVVDINGYFASPGGPGLNLYTVSPCRLVDTRNPNGILGGPMVGAGTTRTLPLPAGSCGLPNIPAVGAYALNITVVPQGPLGYLTTWPTGGTQPAVSTLNAQNGEVVANAAIVPAGATSGSINVFVTNNTDVIIDTNGYFGP